VASLTSCENNLIGGPRSRSLKIAAPAAHVDAAPPREAPPVFELPHIVSARLILALVAARRRTRILATPLSKCQRQSGLGCSLLFHDARVRHARGLVNRHG
jgi:hypothetical protein